MRTLFFMLVFANVLYFAWARWIDVPPLPIIDTSARLPPLKLIDEPSRHEPPPAAHHTSLADGACLSVGPFGDLDSSARAAAILKAKGFGTTQRAAEGQAGDGFWVYVGGLDTQADADHTLAELEKAGIKSAVLMPGTAQGGRRISLGLYTDKSRAQKRAELAQAAGVKAEIAPRKLPVAVYWVDLAPPPGISAVPLQDLFAEGVSTRVGVASCAPAAPPAGAAASSAPAPTPIPATAGGSTASGTPKPP